MVKDCGGVGINISSELYSNWRWKLFASAERLGGLFMGFWKFPLCSNRQENQRKCSKRINDQYFMLLLTFADLIFHRFRLNVYNKGDLIKNCNFSI